MEENSIFLFPQIKTNNPNVVYEIGLNHHGLILAIKGNEKIIFADKLVFNSIENLLKKNKKNVKIKEMEKFETFLKKEKEKDVYLDFSNTSLSFYMKIKKIAKKVKNCSLIWLEKRAKKNEKEIKKLKKASNIAKSVIDYLKENTEKIKEHISEEKIRMLIIEYFAKNDVYESFPSIVASGKRSAYPHHMPTKKTCKELLLIDRGCIYEHYCSDITDVIEIKDKNTLKEYETLKDIFYNLIDNIPSLEKAKELHELYVKLYKKYRLKEMPHLIGHGIGLEVHEWPIINKDSNHLLKNAVITLEPSIYKRNYGLRFERMVYIGKRKAVVL